MDRQLDPTTVGGANMRAALSLGFQGLLRGAEFTVRQKKWNPEKDMSRADIADLSVEKAVVMMLPCKNMQHMNGKTVPLVVGGGGTFIDAGMLTNDVCFSGSTTCRWCRHVRSLCALVAISADVATSMLSPLSVRA